MEKSDENVRITIQGSALQLTRSIPEIQALELLYSLIADGQISDDENKDAPVQLVIDGANIQYHCNIDQALTTQVMKQLLGMTLNTRKEKEE